MPYCKYCGKGIHVPLDEDPNDALCDDCLNEEQHYHQYPWPDDIGISDADLGL